MLRHIIEMFFTEARNLIRSDEIVSKLVPRWMDATVMPTTLELNQEMESNVPFREACFKSLGLDPSLWFKFPKGIYLISLWDDFTDNLRTQHVYFEKRMNPQLVAMLTAFSKLFAKTPRFFNRHVSFAGEEEELPSKDAAAPEVAATSSTGC